MVSSPDHSWSALLGNNDNHSDQLNRDLDCEKVPQSKGYQLNELKPCDLCQGSAQQQHTNSLCQCQTGTRPCPQYHSEISDRTSLMSNNQEPISAQSTVSCSGKPPPEFCLPLQEPLHGTTSLTPSLQSGNMAEEADISEISKPKPQETSIEMSTQTERDMSDYLAPFPLPPPPPPPPPLTMRSDSRTSLTSTVASDVCRICHCESEPGAPLISPCICCGSLKYVHQACLQQWIKSADTKSCELCKFNFEMTTRIKPFRKWQKLEMTTVERRKIMCSVTFHIIAITCVIWSLYVLIDRTTEEIKMGILKWPFWTKLIVVAIGFTGGLVFMYVQCKMYVQLCRRWRAYNRVIFIQNSPNLTGHKIPLQPHMLDGNGRPKEITLPSHATLPVMQETELL